MAFYHCLSELDIKTWRVINLKHGTIVEYQVEWINDKKFF